MKTLFTALIATVAIILAFPGRAEAQIPCFGAPADYVAQFGASYAEPRDYDESQALWLEGPGDPLANIDDAMRASHIHYAKCFPFMETWAEAGGVFKTDLKLQLHHFVGGHAKNVGGMGFEDGGAVKHVFNPVWAPTQQDETRFVSLSRPSSSVKVCGRREMRGHVNTISPDGGEEFFNSFGHQSLVKCTTGRTLGNQRGPSRIYRGWYEKADYTNFTWVDDFRGEVGFRSSQQAAPVVGNLRLKFSLGAGANKWAVFLNPDIHNGSFGTVIARGTGSGTTVTIADALIPSGNFKILGYGCENIGLSSVNPRGGVNCGGGVLTFRGD